jgi:hypothetical protein
VLVHSEQNLDFFALECLLLGLVFIFKLLNGVQLAGLGMSASEHLSEASLTNQSLNLVVLTKQGLFLNGIWTVAGGWL